MNFANTARSISSVLMIMFQEMDKFYRRMQFIVYSVMFRDFLCTSSSVTYSLPDYLASTMDSFTKERYTNIRHRYEIGDCEPGTVRREYPARFPDRLGPLYEPCRVNGRIRETGELQKLILDAKRPWTKRKKFFVMLRKIEQYQLINVAMKSLISTRLNKWNMTSSKKAIFPWIFTPYSEFDSDDVTNYPNIHRWNQ